MLEMKKVFAFFENFFFYLFSSSRVFFNFQFGSFLPFFLQNLNFKILFSQLENYFFPLRLVSCIHVRSGFSLYF